MCGKVMDYEDDRNVILSNQDREKLADLCHSCNDDVLEFIKDGSKRKVRK